MQDETTYNECFTDIGIEQVGDDWDCQTFSSCDGCNNGSGSGRGFVAVKGWDAQTGKLDLESLYFIYALDT